MLVATPLQQIVTDARKPRVISEIKKVTPKTPLDHLQPRISGELLYYNNGTYTWCRRHVQVRGGLLLVAAGPQGGEALRVALRHLNLRPGPAVRTFALYNQGCDNQPIATFQGSTQREYDIWVKILSIELMRQTPLDAIKYLDIMGLAASPSDTLSSTSGHSRRSSSSERSDSTASPTFYKRRCRSELRLDISRDDRTKEPVYSSSDEDYNSNKTESSCVDCQTNKRTAARKSLFPSSAAAADVCVKTHPSVATRTTPMSVDVVDDGGAPTDGKPFPDTYSAQIHIITDMDEAPPVPPSRRDYDLNRNLTISASEIQKRQARERIRRVLSLKQFDTSIKSQLPEKPTPAAETPKVIIQPALRKYDFGTIGYSRVYNVREGVQLKSYDLKNINTSLERLSTKRKDETKLNMLRKSTNTLAEKDVSCRDSSDAKKEYFTLTDYKSRHSKPPTPDDSVFSKSMPCNEKSSTTETQPSKTREFHTRNSTGERFLDVQSDEEAVEVLLQRCQNSDSYVPVKDKLMLFESLCRLGRRLARSSEDLVSLPSNGTTHKRARSMHDLTRCGVGVREICKYFETRSEPDTVSPELTEPPEPPTATQNKYNTIAKGYRNVMRAKDNQSFNFKNHKLVEFKKDYKSSFINDNTNYYFGFKQFREGNKIISYV